MKITLNGSEIDVNSGMSLYELLLFHGIKLENIATEVNLKIIPKSEYKNFTINSGDNIEVIAFVGGG